jgi:hypothetical protein
MLHAYLERLSFQTLWQNCEKGLLVSSCLSARSSVHLSVRMEQHDCHRTRFHKIFFLGVTENLLRKFKCHANIKRITGIPHEDLYICIFRKISRLVLLTMRNISDKFVQKIKTQIFCSINFFPKIVPFMAQPGRSQVTT